MREAKGLPSHSARDQPVSVLKVRVSEVIVWSLERVKITSLRKEGAEKEKRRTAISAGNPPLLQVGSVLYLTLVHQPLRSRFPSLRISTRIFQDSKQVPFLTPFGTPHLPLPNAPGPGRAPWSLETIRGTTRPDSAPAGLQRYH